MNVTESFEAGTNFVRAAANRVAQSCNLRYAACSLAAAVYFWLNELEHLHETFVG